MPRDLARDQNPARASWKQDLTRANRERGSAGKRAGQAKKQIKILLPVADGIGMQSIDEPATTRHDADGDHGKTDDGNRSTTNGDKAMQKTNEIVMSNATPALGSATSVLPSSAPAYVPIVARVPITIRPATMDDLSFIDALQKKQSRELGFLPTAALVGKIELGEVLVAEEGEGVESGQLRVERKGQGERGKGSENADASDSSSLAPDPSPLAPRPSPLSSPAKQVGYLIAADRYQKRDEVGYIVQMNIVADYRRSLVAAQLLQAQFDRSAYGCRLYSCWCAQDLAANRFWEAMGFTAIAFRSGGKGKGRGARKKGQGVRGQGSANANASDSSSLAPNPSPLAPRIHIFWQKRIRAGDRSTPFWYPSTTGNGQMRADRLVFPIPDGMHWSEVTAIDIEPAGEGQTESNVEPSTLNVQRSKNKAAKTTTKNERRPSEPQRQRIDPNGNGIGAPRVKGGLWFSTDYRKPATLDSGNADSNIERSKKEQAKAKPAAVKAKPAAVKIDPRLKKLARELRDQWSERQADSQESVLLMEESAGKYDVKRLASPTAINQPSTAVRESIAAVKSLAA